jgi:hypothetical protein
VDLKRAGRHTEYTKLWRVDGTIDIGRWKSVIHNHFRDNTLVSEYFGSQKSKVDIREELEKPMCSHNPSNSTKEYLGYATMRDRSVS